MDTMSVATRLHSIGGRRAIAFAAVLGATLLLLATGRSVSSATTVPAHAARALNVTDTAHLHNVKSPGSQLVDEGTATGTLPATVRVSFSLGATVSAEFTIYGHGWSIVGQGSGLLHRNKTKSNVYVSFAGTMTVSHGTGRYAHAHGHGGFYGILDRTNYAATIQTTGTLTY
jgi:hypothetical protein